MKCLIIGFILAFVSGIFIGVSIAMEKYYFGIFFWIALIVSVFVGIYFDKAHGRLK